MGQKRKNGQQKEMSRKDYEKELKKLHVELVKLARRGVTGAERFLAAFDKAGTPIGGLSKPPPATF